MYKSKVFNLFLIIDNSKTPVFQTFLNLEGAILSECQSLTSLVDAYLTLKQFNRLPCWDCTTFTGAMFCLERLPFLFCLKMTSLYSRHIRIFPLLKIPVNAGKYNTSDNYRFCKGEERKALLLPPLWGVLTFSTAYAWHPCSLSPHRVLNPSHHYPCRPRCINAHKKKQVYQLFRGAWGDFMKVTTLLPHSHW